MEFWRQEYWSGLLFPSPVDHVLSELSTMSCPWLALHGMAHSFIELDKTVVHIVSLFSFLWLWFLFCLPSTDKDKRLMDVSWWERQTAGKLGLVLMGRAMLSKSWIQASVYGRGCIPSLLFDLRLNYGGGNEDNFSLLQKVLCTHCCTQCPDPAADLCRSMLPPETPGYS